MNPLLAAKHHDSFLVYEHEPQNMDDHGQYDQWQSPFPVGAPCRLHDKIGVESGSGNSHRAFVLRLPFSQLIISTDVRATVGYDRGQ